MFRRGIPSRSAFLSWRGFPLVVSLILSFLALSASVPPAQANDLTTGLVAYWNFENGSTLGTPLYGTLNLTNAGSPAYTNTGGYGSSKGLSLNGNSYLQASSYPSTLNGNNPYTIATWFKTASAGNGGILGYGTSSTCQGNNLRLNGSTNLHSYWYGCDLTSSTVPNFVGTWHHVAVTYDGTTLKFYYDGAFLNSGTGQTRATTGTNFYLGKTTADVAFNGVLDEVALYTKALTLAEVQSLKNGGLNYNAATTLTLSVAGNTRVVAIRQSLTLTSVASVEGRVTFRSNGKAVGGCVGVLTVSLTATCAWKPSIKGASQLTARLVPTQVASNAIANSSNYWISVAPRTNKRGG
ncbi:MAG: hypothetical protein F2555_02190 [Actinobacteria bacterium]|uniref:Unannotated protein n=1 Tax=freshwater metagenome TaxID=449393 RepID=A0A6J6DYG8_9ZZZZ|nr:hypothetical protein [Actinomycetota bacterium]